MFDNLSQRFSQITRDLSGRGRMTEANIQDALREVRIALLEADVALSVVKDFIDDIQTKAIGMEVTAQVAPGEALIKIVHDELVQLMGDAQTELDLKITPPAIILVAGLQGSGKTTTVGKLAYLLKTQLNKKVMLVSTDIYRPAAIDQLQSLASQVGVEYFPSTTAMKPIDIAKQAIDAAKKQFCDVLLIDTAGRLHIDAAMMAEIKSLHSATSPRETLFVVDSMTGQDAANTAKAFHEALPLTGVILTKTDGDARGGAALSIRQITGKPIKFMGTGEKIDKLEAFHPERVASRILGMGDILSLVEEAERKLDKQKAEKIAQKLKKGKTFDLRDFLEQLEQMRNMGGIAGIMSKMPGMAAVPKAAKSMVNDKMFDQMRAMIQSMTPKERRLPDIIKNSRKQRIADGSGTKIQDVNRLLKQFHQMQKMMKKLKGGGMMKMLNQLKGQLPPGGGF